MDDLWDILAGEDADDGDELESTFDILTGGDRQ